MTQNSNEEGVKKNCNYFKHIAHIESFAEKVISNRGSFEELAVSGHKFPRR